MANATTKSQVKIDVTTYKNQSSHVKEEKNSVSIPFGFLWLKLQSKSIPYIGIPIPSKLYPKTVFWCRERELPLFLQFFLSCIQ